MKNLFILILNVIFLFNGYSQKKEKKKIKEEYIESISLSGNQKNHFTEYNISGEPIKKGKWKFNDTIKKEIIKTDVYKVLTEKEKNYTYAYDKNNNIISKTLFYTKEDNVDQFENYIKSYEILIYDYKNRLYKSELFRASIDTTDSGIEELNDYYIDYTIGEKKLSQEFIRYNFKKESIIKYNKNNQIELKIEFDFYAFDNYERYDYFYDTLGNIESYTIQKLISDETSTNSGANIIDWQSEYSVTYKFDEFNNWIERITYEDTELFLKEKRQLKYY